MNKSLFFVLAASLSAIGTRYKPTIMIINANIITCANTIGSVVKLSDCPPRRGVNNKTRITAIS